MSVTVIKREKGCVTLSDGRRVVRTLHDMERFDERGWLQLPLWEVVGPDGPDGNCVRTLREALKAAGVAK